MYLNAFVLWSVLSNSLLPLVAAKRLSSPRHLFSDESDIDKGKFTVYQNSNKRFTRSTDEENLHHRHRRDSPPLTDPDIFDSGALCSHDTLTIHWTIANEITPSSNGTIVALCHSRQSPTQPPLVLLSDDFGANWTDITSRFNTKNNKKPRIDNFYNAPEHRDLVIFVDKKHRHIYHSNDGGRNISHVQVSFEVNDISINPYNPLYILAYGVEEKKKPQLHISKNGSESFKVINAIKDVSAFYWGSKTHGDNAEDLFVEGKASDGGKVQGYKLDCSMPKERKSCIVVETLTNKSPLNGDITDFLVKEQYMFVTKQRQDRNGVDLYVKYLRTGSFKKADIVTTPPMQEVFIYDVSGGMIMMVANLRKNETNLYNSLDETGANFSLSLPRVLYHNPGTEVSAHWLRRAVSYRFVDISRIEGLPSVYFATQLTVGPVGGRYLISVQTFDKGGVWKRVKGPDRYRNRRKCFYPSCSLHVNLFYGSIYRYSQSTALMSRKSAPGLIMATGVLGTNLKITPDTYLSRDGGQQFTQVLSGKRRFSFGDQGGFILASDFGTSQFLQYSVDFKRFHRVKLSDSFVNIKKILTEPGEKGLIFLVLGTVGGKFHIFQVNATKTLRRPCTDKDYYMAKLNEVGIGGCEIEYVQLRKETSFCITGTSRSRVNKTSYENCFCRRRHYQCDLNFMPRIFGGCEQIKGTNLIPKTCPEGQFYLRSQGYSKLPDRNCKSDNYSRETFSSVRKPCPVERLLPVSITTKPQRRNGILYAAVGEEIFVNVSNSNGYIENINFTYEIDNNINFGLGAKYSKFSFNLTKSGLFTLRVKISNPKTYREQPISVEVQRKLNDGVMNLILLSSEILTNRRLAFALRRSPGVNLKEYGSQLSYKWKVETHNPSRKVISQNQTQIPLLYMHFSQTGGKTISVTVSNAVSSMVKTLSVYVTKDIKVRNVKVRVQSRSLLVTWDDVNDPEVVQYRVLYRKVLETSYHEVKCADIKKMECRIMNFTYNAQYRVRVGTVLKNGLSGPPSDEVNVTTPMGKPDVPGDVRLHYAGKSQIRATWKPPAAFNGVPVGYRCKFYKSKENPTEQSIKDPNRTSWVFRSLTTGALYHFEIAAENKEKLGEYSRVISAIAEVGKPTMPPSNLAVKNLTTTTSRIVWDPPKIGKDSTSFVLPENYVVCLINDRKEEKSALTEENEYIFSGLRPSTNYNVTVSANSSRGKGPKAVLSFTTRGYEPPLPPVDLRLNTVGSRDASFTWKTAENEDVILGYKVYQLSPPPLGKAMKVDKREVLVRGLKPYTTYVFAVTSLSKFGESRRSGNFSFTTNEDKPGPPHEVRVYDVWPLSSSFLFTWDPPDVQNGVLTKYKVTWYPESNPKKVKAVEKAPDNRTHRVDHLKADTKYKIEVRASTKVGESSPHVETRKTHWYPYGTEKITILFIEKDAAMLLTKSTDFEANFVYVVSKTAKIRKERIADVNLDEKQNGVGFYLISKENLHDSHAAIVNEMNNVKALLSPSFSVNGKKTKPNTLNAEVAFSSSPRANDKSSNTALVVGLICAAVIIILIIVIALMYRRYRRKSMYNKFDNQFHYDDNGSYPSSPGVEMVPPPQKRRHKDIEAIPLADADQLT